MFRYRSIISKDVVALYHILRPLCLILSAMMLLIFLFIVGCYEIDLLFLVFFGFSRLGTSHSFHSFTTSLLSMLSLLLRSSAILPSGIGNVMYPHSHGIMFPSVSSAHPMCI